MGPLRAAPFLQLMMEPLTQRTEDDCTICAVAMVMGTPYTYERVAEDRKKYALKDGEGRSLPWWRDYLRDEGFEVEYPSLTDLRRFSDFEALPEGSRAMLVFQVPVRGSGHIVAIDEQGVIDPQRGIDGDTAHYQSVSDFSEIFKLEGWRLYDRGYWLIRKKNSVPEDQSHP